MATSINTQEIPVSTIQSATAASYTIPADRYAIVRAHVRNGGTLNINGTQVMGSSTWNEIAVNSSPGSVTQSGSAVMMAVPMYGGGSNIAMGSQTGTSVMISSTASNFGNGGAIFSNGTGMTVSDQMFKVPAGAIIVGSGTASYHIELYRIAGSPT